MKHVFSISFEILGSHAQITEMKFTRAIGRTRVHAIGRTRVFLLAELPAKLITESVDDLPIVLLKNRHTNNAVN